MLAFIAGVLAGLTCGVVAIAALAHIKTLKHGEDVCPSCGGKKNDSFDAHAKGNIRYKHMIDA